MNDFNSKEILISVFSIALKIVLIVIAAMFIYKYAIVGYEYGYRIFGEKPVSSGEGRTVTVNIKSDMGVKDIGQLLENKGLIRDGKLFVIQERLSENHGNIVPGEYELSTAMTAEQMIAIMARADIEEEQEEEGNSEVMSTENAFTGDDADGESLSAEDSEEPTGEEAE